jgi:hypothetical protein
MEMGHRCGCVCVPEGNRFHGIEEGESVPDAIPNLHRPMGEDLRMMINVVCGDKQGALDRSCTIGGMIDVHGGVTFAGHLDINKTEWYVGFDCAHCTDKKDLSLIKDPKLKRIYEDMEGDLDLIYEKYFAEKNPMTVRHLWTTDDVVRETEKLADQIADEYGAYEKDFEEEF